MPGIPAAIGGAGVRGHPGHLPGRRRRAHVRPRPRRRDRTRRRTSTGAGWRASAARSSATRARGRSARSRKALLSHGRAPDEPAALDLRRDAAVAADGRRARSARSRRTRAIDAPALLVIGAVAGAARAPALVRRSAAVRPAHRRHAIARAGRRAHRHAGGARRRSDPGADDPHRAAGGSGAARPGASPTRGTFDWIVFTSANAVDYFMQRLLATGDVRDLKGVKLCTVGPSTAARLQRYGIRVDLTPAEYRAEAVVEALTAAGPLKGARVLLPRADIAPRGARRRAARSAGAEVTDVVAYRTTLAQARARRRSRHLPDAARSADRRRDVHQRVDGPQLRADPRRRSRPPICCATTVVASIGPVTAEAAQQLGIATTVHAGALHDSGSRRRARRAFRGSRRRATTRMAASDRPRGRSDLRHRPRRLRRTAAIRALVRETRLSPEMFIYPLFVCTGEGQRREVGSMPGVFQLSVDESVKEARGGEGRRRPRRAAVRPARQQGRRRRRRADDPEGPVQSAVRALKREVPDLLVVTDVCLCEYTSHGHCGIAGRRRDPATTRRSSSSRARRCRTPPPAPTSSRRRT